MLADMLIFAIMAYFYKYVNNTDTDNSIDDKLALEEVKKEQENDETKIHKAEVAAIPSL